MDLMSKNLRFIVASLLSLFATKAAGQAGLIPGTSDPSKADLQSLTQNRSLVSATVAPDEKRVDVFLVGTEEGSFDIQDLKIFMASLGEHKKSEAVIQASADPVKPAVAVNYTHSKGPMVVHRHKKSKKHHHSTSLQARIETEN
jgi:hypothetical protein